MTVDTWNYTTLIPVSQTVGWEESCLTWVIIHRHRYYIFEVPITINLTSNNDGNE